MISNLEKRHNLHIHKSSEVNFVVFENHEKLGPYTYIMSMKHPNFMFQCLPFKTDAELEAFRQKELYTHEMVRGYRIAVNLVGALQDIGLRSDNANDIDQDILVTIKCAAKWIKLYRKMDDDPKYIPYRVDTK